MLVPGGGRDYDIFVIANSFWEGHAFELPALHEGRKWFRFIDTMLDSPDDCSEDGKERVMENQGGYDAGPRSVVVLISKPTG